MTRRRWIADDVRDSAAFLRGDNARHLAQVLRARPGQQFEIAASGQVRLGTVVRVRDDEVEFSLGQVIAPAADLSASISLLQAVFKFDRMEWAIEKATELGVARIIPVIAGRTEKHLAQASARRVERWRKLAREAAQQSRRHSAPEVAEPVKLKEALESVPNGAGRLLLAEGEVRAEIRRSLRAALDALPPEAAIVLGCGPEGGWTAQDLQLFQAAGWQPVSLGPAILRAETAAIAALSVARLRGD